VHLFYRHKVIYAFEEIAGSDVAFFAMHVQEYGSGCPAPNTRRVYIAYLDSVHFFQPKEHRTSVYHQMLLAYLDHVKRLGFLTAHIWACPPVEGNDYIFYGHPPDQKVPKPKRLYEWYKKMLDKGISENIVIGYQVSWGKVAFKASLVVLLIMLNIDFHGSCFGQQDICRQAVEDQTQSVTQLPYFEGDHWPESYEFVIRLMKKEEEELTEVSRLAKG
jgi:E1A/CREB-binding protein